MLKIGEFEVYLLRSGQVMVDGGGPFGLVPRKLWQRYLQPTEDNLVPMSLTNLLIKAGDKHILVDTGLGSKLDYKQQRQWGLTHPDGTLLVGLARLGLTQVDIDVVFNTHLHADHCAGNTFYTEDGQLLPTFPKATYYVQRREYEDAMRPNERTRATYYAENVVPLMEAGLLQLLDEPETEILPGLRGVVTPGHTPAHMSLIIESKGEYGFFLCDLASYMVHFERLAWMTAYDVEPLVTLETKRRWQQWAVEHNALLLSAHDSQMPTARLKADEEGHFRLEAVPVQFD